MGADQPLRATLLRHGPLGAALERPRLRTGRAHRAPPGATRRLETWSHEQALIEQGSRRARPGRKPRASRVESSTRWGFLRGESPGVSPRSNERELSCRDKYDRSRPRADRNTRLALSPFSRSRAANQHALGDGRFSPRTLSVCAFPSPAPRALTPRPPRTACAGNAPAQPEAPGAPVTICHSRTHSMMVSGRKTRLSGKGSEKPE